jgi:hypothetical protein
MLRLVTFALILNGMLPQNLTKSPDPLLLWRCHTSMLGSKFKLTDVSRQLMNKSNVSVLTSAGK